MPILPAVREAETRRVARARRRTIDDIRNERERSHCFRPHAGNGEELLEVLRGRFVGRKQDFPQMPRIDVALYIHPVPCR